MKLEKYPKGNEALSKEALEKLPWAKFKIVVPSKEDAQKIALALKYLHYCDIDTGYIWVNQIVHAYHLDEGTVVVDKEVFDVL